MERKKKLMIGGWTGCGEVGGREAACEVRLSGACLLPWLQASQIDKRKQYYKKEYREVSDGVESVGKPYRAGCTGRQTVLLKSILLNKLKQRKLIDH